jgi:hypothetical protein
MKRKPFSITFLLLIMMTFSLAVFPASATPLYLQNVNPNHPSQPVKLIFIHHSTGENWLRDDYGGLGQALADNNYFVSDTNYGWGPDSIWEPDSIGDDTDIPYWIEWFASDQTPTYMNALFNESGQHADYTRLPDNPGGENQIIMFKSCFPNSALEGNPTDPPDPDGWLTVGHAKYVYNEILQYFRTRPDKLFIVITAPPLIDSTYAENARAFNQWLMNDWLAENNYTLPNVAVFDFYNVLTGPNNHHWWHNGQVEHVFTPGMNTEYYPSGDDHPSEAGSLKATSEFIPLLNIFYHRWAAATTFTDVPSTYWAYSWITRLYAAGITSGCGTNPLIYCPEDSVTRAQMAIFLERGMHGSTYTPPAGTGAVFVDVSLSTWGVNWIEKLYSDGITGGCLTSPLSYCPANPVTRAQMAKFLLLAKHGASYSPPAAAGIFADVPTSYWAASWIEQLYTEGITGGCSLSPLSYCPENSVTRAQMAKFLVLTFNLP